MISGASTAIAAGAAASPQAARRPRGERSSQLVGDGRGGGADRGGDEAQADLAVPEQLVERPDEEVEERWAGLAADCAARVDQPGMQHNARGEGLVAVEALGAE